MQSNMPLEAILKLVAYLEVDERDHFEHMQANAEDVSRHIYQSVKVVSDWLDTQPGMTATREREWRGLRPTAEISEGKFADYWQHPFGR